MSEAAQHIFKGIYTWRFKRCNTPDREGIVEVIERSVRAGTAIPAVSYWGCGDRSFVNRYDVQALDFLGEFRANATRLWAPGIAVTFVMTDIHGVVNGKDPGGMERYFEGIRELMAERGYDSLLLSRLWEEGGYSVADLDGRWPALEGEWERLSIRHLLVARARRHARGVDPVLAARRYLAACSIDAEVVGRRFPGSILISYNGPDYAPILPPLPKMYLCSLKRRSSVKPWHCS